MSGETITLIAAIIAKAWQHLLFACVFLGFAVMSWAAVLDQQGLIRL